MFGSPGQRRPQRADNVRLDRILKKFIPNNTWAWRIGPFRLLFSPTTRKTGATMPSKNSAGAEPRPKLIPLNRLKKSPRNARQVPHTKEDIEALAASIAVHGLLQNPVVEPELDRKQKPTGYFLVTIGEGRRQALLLRARRKQITADHPVRCVVDAGHDALEISLAENAIRSGMHPADQFDAFHHLHNAKGMSAEDIGARFDVPAAVC